METLITVRPEQAQNGEPSDALLRSGALTIDLGGFAVKVGGSRLPLSYHELCLLIALAKHPNQVTRREELASVTGMDSSAQIEVLNRRVHTNVSRLRRKLEAAGCGYISTVRCVGYRFEPCGRVMAEV